MLCYSCYTVTTIEHGLLPINNKKYSIAARQNHKEVNGQKFIISTTTRLEINSAVDSILQIGIHALLYTFLKNANGKKYKEDIEFSLLNGVPQPHF